MWSIFGTTDEITSVNPIGSLSKKSKGAVYSDGAWCGYCVKVGMRTWMDSNKKICPTCKKRVPKVMRIADI